MPWVTSTVGNAASGATYAADVGALQLWENVVDDGPPGDYEAIVITDITDDLTVSGFAAGDWNLWIHGDLTGNTKRVITAGTQASGDGIRSTDADVNTILVEDLKWVGGGGATSAGMRIENGTVSTFRRCWFHGYTEQGVDGRSPFTAENCISTNNGVATVRAGFRPNGTGTTSTCRNCISVGNGYGFFPSNDATITFRCYNCTAFGNGTQDVYTSAANATFDFIGGVTGDNTGTHANVDDKTGTVVNKNAFATSYFQDYANRDLRLVDSAANLWGNTPNVANTPTDDFVTATRSARDAGPYEFAPAFFNGAASLVGIGTIGATGISFTLGGGSLTAVAIINAFGVNTVGQLFTHRVSSRPVDPADPVGVNILQAVYEQTDATGYTVNWLNGPTLTPDNQAALSSANKWRARFEVTAPVGTVLEFRRRAQDTAGLWSDWQTFQVTVVEQFAEVVQPLPEATTNAINEEIAAIVAGWR